MIKVAGININLGEIEALLRGHPGVLEAAVVPIQDDRMGEAPFAFFVAERDVADPESMAREACGAITGLQRPRGSRVLLAMPRLSSGKVDKRALRAMLDGERPVVLD